MMQFMYLHFNYDTFNTLEEFTFENKDNLIKEHEETLTNPHKNEMFKGNA